jgi:protein gp37
VAESSNISWTRSTFNPVIGCTKVGPGCDACYAEAMDKRMRFGGAAHWGPGVSRFRTSEGNWKQVLKWDAKAKVERDAGILWNGRPGYWPVFCASLADVFDNEWPIGAREDLWRLIEQTPNLSWLLVTKRIGNVPRMVPAAWMNSGFPANVRLLISACNQEEADRDIPKLLALRCKNGISYEPALGPIDFTVIPHPGTAYDRSLGGQERVKSYWLNALDGTRGVLMKNGDVLEAGEPGSHLGWIIVGGESSQGAHKARPFDIKWARNTIAQCKAAGVPVFMKQVGSNVAGLWPLPNIGPPKDRAGADPAEWPEDLRVQEFPI